MTGTCLTHSSCCACLSLPCLLYSTSSKMKMRTRAIPPSQMAIDCSFARSQPKRSKMVQRSGHMAQYCRIYHQTRPESACQMLLLSGNSTNFLTLVRTLIANGGNSEPKENLTELRVAAVALKCRLRLQANSPKGTHRENFSNCNSPVNLQVVCRGFDCGPAVGGTRFFAASGSARPGGGGSPFFGRKWLRAPRPNRCTGSRNRNCFHAPRAQSPGNPWTKNRC